MDLSINIILSVVLGLAVMGGVGWFALTTISGSTSTSDVITQSLNAVHVKDGAHVSVRLKNTGAATIISVVPVMSIDGRHYLLEVDGLPANQFSDISIKGHVSDRSIGYEKLDNMLKFGEAILLDHIINNKNSPTRLHNKMADIDKIYHELENLGNDAKKIAAFRAIPNDEKISILSRELSGKEVLDNKILDAQELWFKHRNVLQRLESQGGSDIPLPVGSCTLPQIYPNPYQPGDCSIRQFYGETFASGEKITITVIMETTNGDRIEKLISMRIT